MGFTPFAAIVLSLCIIPLAAAALATHTHVSRLLHKHRHHNFSEVESLLFGSDEASNATFWAAWGGASCLWFFVPFASCMSSPFYQTDFYHAVLAVALSAAFPLSWHLSYVAIPASGASYLVLFLGISSATLKQWHKLIGWLTLFWAVVHAGGEVIYLTSQGQWALEFGFKTDNDNLLFVFGFISLALLLLHTTVARLRRHPRIAPTFVNTHRALACGLLLSASAHWWPFVFFLTPAIACSATGLAIQAMKQDRPSCCKGRYAPLALATALVAAAAGICPVWALRQTWMEKHGADFYGPFAFPPASVALAFVSARVAAAIAIKVMMLRSGSRSETCHQPLLINDGAQPL